MKPTLIEVLRKKKYDFEVNNDRGTAFVVVYSKGKKSCSFTIDEQDNILCVCVEDNIVFNDIMSEILEGAQTVQEAVAARSNAIICISVIAEEDCDLQNVANILSERAMECEGIVGADGSWDYEDILNGSEDE